MPRTTRSAGALPRERGGVDPGIIGASREAARAIVRRERLFQGLGDLRRRVEPLQLPHRGRGHPDRRERFAHALRPSPERGDSSLPLPLGKGIRFGDEDAPCRHGGIHLGWTKAIRLRPAVAVDREGEPPSVRRRSRPSIDRERAAMAGRVLNQRIGVSERAGRDDVLDGRGAASQPPPLRVHEPVPLGGDDQLGW